MNPNCLPRSHQCAELSKIEKSTVLDMESFDLVRRSVPVWSAAGIKWQKRTWNHYWWYGWIGIMTEIRRSSNQVWINLIIRHQIFSLRMKDKTEVTGRKTRWFSGFTQWCGMMTEEYKEPHIWLFLPGTALHGGERYTLTVVEKCTLPHKGQIYVVKEAIGTTLRCELLLSQPSVL